MKIISKSISYLLHPVFIPLIATGCYFYFTKEFYQIKIIKFTLFQVSIMTLAIPIFLFLVLKSLDVLNSSVMVNDLNERKLPIFFNILLLSTLIFKFWEFNPNNELKLFFIGYLITYIVLFTGVFLKKKISIHTAALASTLPFTFFTSISHYQPLIWQTCVLIITIGLLIGARLYLKAHTNFEVIAGFFIGIIPQIIFRNYLIGL